MGIVLPQRKTANCHNEKSPTATIEVLKLTKHSLYLLDFKVFALSLNEVDKRGEDGQFMLTGSAVPANREEIFHSGTGRFAWFKLRTMSLWESEDSTGEVSLAKIFATDKESYFVEGINHIDLTRLAFLTCRGGWPKAINKRSEKASLMQAIEYYEAVTRFDVSRVDGVKRDGELAQRIMRSYARNQGSQDFKLIGKQDRYDKDESSFL